MEQETHSNKRKWYVIVYASGRTKVVHGWDAVCRERRDSKESFVFHGYHTVEGARGEVKHRKG